MDKKRFFSLFLVVLLLSSFISGCAGVGRIDDFFQNGEYQQHSKIIDFGLFFVMFFALAYLGLSKVWGEGFGKPGTGKGPIVALSLALALALSFAIVTQTRFSITTIFPVAKAIFFLIIFFVLWGLMVMSKMFGEGGWGKFIAAVLALIATYLIFSIGTHMICQMSDNMDDPACKSDFFNAFFTILGRIFGIDEWGFGGGTGGGTGGTGGEGGAGGGAPGGGGTGGGGTTSTGPVEGGCRLDITFVVDSPTQLVSPAPVADYIARVKGMKKSSIHVYGFASKEGQERYNAGLAWARARTIEDMIKSADSSMGASLSSKGPTERFDTADYPENRRVVLSTESISSFTPAPAAGSMSNCPEPGQQVCGDSVKESNEQCDGNDDEACPKKCQSNCTCPAAPTTPTPPVVPPGCGDSTILAPEKCDPKAQNNGGCPTDQHCGANCSKCEPGAAATTPTPAKEGGGLGKWWFVIIPLIILLALLIFRNGYNQYQKRVMGVDIDNIDNLLRMLILRALEKCNAISNNVKQNALTLPEIELFRNCVRRGGPLLHRRIRNNLGPAGVRGVVFAPTLTPDQRTALIEDVYQCADALHRAKRLVGDKRRHWLWPKLLSIRRLEDRLNRAHVSPIVHADRKVTFNYNDALGSATDVQLRIANAPIGTAGLAYTNTTMTRNGNVWTLLTAAPLAVGTYRYKFRIQRGAGTAYGYEWDPSNAKRAGANPTAGFNEVTIGDVLAQAAHLHLPGPTP